jgi:hypothetical protein
MGSARRASPRGFTPTARVRQIVMEPSVALDEEYDTLVVSHRWPALSRPLIAGVHDRGRRAQ